jgi:hypothetical protein
MTVHLFGEWSVQLNPDQEEVARAWLKMYRTCRILPINFKVLPCYTDAEQPGKENFAFSCVGFVLCCYERLGLPLFQTSSLPSVTLGQLASVFGDILDAFGGEEDDVLLQIGLDPAGRRTGWPVPLPGYTLHAFDRSPGEYTPTGFSQAAYP